MKVLSFFTRLSPRVILFLLFIQFLSSLSLVNEKSNNFNLLPGLCPVTKLLSDNSWPFLIFVIFSFSLIYHSSQYTFPKPALYSSHPALCHCGIKGVKCRFTLCTDFFEGVLAVLWLFFVWLVWVFFVVFFGCFFWGGGGESNVEHQLWISLSNRRW